MAEPPTKRVHAKLGSKLFEFAADEETNFQNAAYELIEEMHFFDTIATLMSNWLNRNGHLLPEESIFYSLCSFMRTQMFQGCSTFMRGHLSTGMVTARLCVESALYADAIAGGYITEEDYLTDDAKRENLTRHLRNFQRDGRLPKRMEIELECISMLSAHGAHAEVQVWGNRLIGGPGEGWYLSYFQKPKSPERFAYDFLGIMWFAGLSFMSFLLIGQEKFGIDCREYLDALRAWQDEMEQNKLKFRVA